MGGELLKEALKCLCGENRWSYGIFWKIGCRNPTLLVWEDYHYEPSPSSALSNISGIDSADLLVKEWEGLWGHGENWGPQIGGHVEDRVGSLLNKMMLSNHIHVVGEGIVGRAAFTDAHVWILQENIMRDQYPSEVLAEVHHQFSAGMQTVAAIPVLPHGVIQLGSILMIAENMGFINDVQSLFTQLGGAPYSLSSDYYTKEDASHTTATPPLFGIPISTDLARKSCSQGSIVAPFMSANTSQEMCTSQLSGFSTQPRHAFTTQIQAYMQSNSVLRSSGLSPIMPESANYHDQVKSHQVIKPHLPLSDQLGARKVGAQVILSSPDAWFQQDSVYPSSSRSKEQLVQSSSSLNSYRFMEQQLMSSVGLQEPVNCGPASNSARTSHLRSYGGKIPNPVKDSIVVSLLGGNKPANARRDRQMLTSIPSTMSSSSNPRDEGLKFTSSDKDVLHASNHGDLSDKSYLLQDVSQHSYPSNLISSKLTKGKQAIESDLFQTLHIPLHQSGNCIPRSDPLTDYLHECSLSNSTRAKDSLCSQNVISEDSFVQLPSGDDLFDILGLDTKSKQLYGNWNNVPIHGEDTKTENVNMDVSTCITRTETGHEINNGISASGIFSGTDSDHLLDAVVSKLHSSAKQNSDDNMSCWTTLTKMRKSSALTDSLTSDRVNVTDPNQLKVLGFPSPLSKSQLTASTSVRTGCSFDVTGERSQINSLYGSEISLLCEDGLTVKRDSSNSTAHSRKPDETAKVNRKRLRPGENPRPRPKDRQMIQDRVKELREIVPNGAKCSIDALLERTIKHMLFLQSVTKHAEKLKHKGESKIISRDGGLLMDENFDGGATWAFEVGSQSMVCPIIVEDLNTPRQMLVEMLCEEQGFFLEIADIIRGLGLTILKGVMEARNNKVWVRFTVEANRDVTRMEIFLSLVHLLEQTMKSTAPAPTDADNNNMMAHNTFHQASLPNTGRSVSLQ